MNLNIFMEHGISGVMKTAARFYLNNGKGRMFMAKILPEIHKNAKIREKNEQAGTHVPPFLIASIASQCNLHCAGCYARAESECGDSGNTGDLNVRDWKSIFSEAAGLGVSFILLAGGEPLTRPDVINAAASFSNMVFPIFTNGTMINEEYLLLFDRSRNLIPVISIEGGADDTDRRRGSGIYEQAETAMAHFNEKHILYGVSITVTRENMQTVTSDSFVSKLHSKGCGLIFFVEYVPVAEDTETLVLCDQDICVLKESVTQLKKRYGDMVIISFPGDEEAMGGCLASGRGFFHINARGGAEPCPFSPYSRYNLKDTSIAEVLRSDFFRDLCELAACADMTQGGCTLFDRKDQVRSMLAP